LGIHARVDEPGIAEHPQVLRHRRLADGELVNELADGALAVAEQVEDAPALRLGEDVEGEGHTPHIA